MAASRLFATWKQDGERQSAEERKRSSPHYREYDARCYHGPTLSPTANELRTLYALAPPPRFEHAVTKAKGRHDEGDRPRLDH
jgi:hypothetical protein